MRSDALATRKNIKTKGKQEEVTCRRHCKRFFSEWIRFEHKWPLSKWNETVNVCDSIWFSEPKPITMPFWSSKSKKKKCDWIFNIASFRSDYLGITSSCVVLCPMLRRKGMNCQKGNKFSTYLAFDLALGPVATVDLTFYFFSRTFIFLEFI